MDTFSAQKIHFTGIKGVAMTSLAQCLIDLNKQISGSDLEEDFVTKDILGKLHIPIAQFSANNIQPHTVDLVIYTSAHQGPQNPEVIAARSQNIKTLSQAEALAQLFNIKRGIAVCGVGGKSSTSAMITWILDKLQHSPSFSVGVGKIIGMERTGRWVADSAYFVAEADEYVIDPHGDPKVPRFSFLQPEIIVCTNIAHDHPDVYPSFEHTKLAFHNFFMNLKPDGKLIINGDDTQLVQIADNISQNRADIQVIRYGESVENDWIVSDCSFQPERSTATLRSSFGTAELQLSLPGKYNLMNATAACVASSSIIPELSKRVEALTTFRSTQRRFEFVGEKKGVKYYDDYAHHPSEIASVINALNEWYPTQRKVIAFQPHTFSRTRRFFTNFLLSFSQAKELLLLDIFASAREPFDPEMDSDLLAKALQDSYPESRIENVKTNDKLREWCDHQLRPGDICLTLGAGDIYQVHDKISAD